MRPRPAVALDFHYPEDNVRDANNPATNSGERGVTDMGDELSETMTRAMDERLADAAAALVRQFPGDAPDRQPVHTVYVPADRFDDGFVATWGAAALAAIAQHPGTFPGL